MEQNLLAIRCWIFFCFNYWNVDNVISFICGRTGTKDLENYLREKFEFLYDRHGAWAAMQLFYTELDSEKQIALVEYALTKYAPVGMRLNEEEKKMLAI